MASPSAIIITVGSELTDGRIIDTNSAWLASDLAQRSVPVRLMETVPDSEAGIGRALHDALASGASLVILAGGLGPTVDDLTVAAVAKALGLELIEFPEAAAMVASALGVAEPDLTVTQRMQAELPAGSIVLPPAGVAPGFMLEAPRKEKQTDDDAGEPGNSLIVVLPGVPWEARDMWQRASATEPLGSLFAGAEPSVRRTLAFYGVREPDLNEAVAEELAALGQRLAVSICARRYEVLLEVSGPAAQKDRIEELMSTVAARFAEQVYSRGENIEEVVAARLTRLSKTLAVGESCTGGMLGETITSVSGSSAFFLGGVIAYSNDVKHNTLKVRSETLERVGAVSEPVAQQLALGVRALTGADYGVGITGVAGPTGGTPEKPVGLVYICVSSEEGDVVKGFNFPGGREEVRSYSVTAALHMLNRKLDADEAASQSW